MDFIKRLPRKQNIPVIIYLFINLVILYFGNFLTIEALISGISDGAALAISVPVSLIVYAIGVVIALSPVGEWILRKKTHCKKFDNEAAERRAKGLFEEVLSRAKEINPSIPDDITLYYVDDEEVNAFAVGRKTIGITEGALGLSDDQIKGILGHELGHLSNHDTDLTLVVNVANFFVTVYFLIIRAFILLMKATAKGAAFIGAFLSASISEFLTNVIIVRFINLIDFVLITLVSALWTAFGNLLIKASTRSNEYLADEFSKKLGYGDALISVIETFENVKTSKNPLKRLSASLADTHPTPKKRIEALRNSRVSADFRAEAKQPAVENHGFTSKTFAPAVPAFIQTAAVKPETVYDFEIREAGMNGTCKKCQSENTALYRFTLMKNGKSSSVCLCEDCCRAMAEKVRMM